MTGSILEKRTKKPGLRLRSILKIKEIYNSIIEALNIIHKTDIYYQI